MDTAISLSKRQVRAEIAALKRKFSATELGEFSSAVVSRLEQTEEFRNAAVLFIYYGVDDEVCTRGLIEKYLGTKRILLPVVEGNDLLLRELEDIEQMEVATYGILEPKGGAVFRDYPDIDLAVIPGVAFDRKLHRLGRGKGFYDRLLPVVKAPKIGLCFDFQLRESIPFDMDDVPMDRVITQREEVKKLDALSS
ncbi:MAG: 5-formyltetrahydrofolate cyclo-ligase [Dysgonamonadaceae bacterium]|jgi:5-formyltetrahydrofolate cyclo-ligase|nr:5-formyltetrahydrofolate cyclo-ligase [Dysgonamonadaceae bacterium]